MGARNGLSRREFVERAGRLSAAVACGCTAVLTGGCASFPRVSPRMEEGVARVPLTAFSGGPGLLVDHPADALPIYVHRHEDGTFTALSTRCTHRGCEVDPTPDRLACPCHGSEFDLREGAVLAGPADRPLPRYPVVAGADEIRVDLSAGRAR